MWGGRIRKFPFTILIRDVASIVVLLLERWVLNSLHSGGMYKYFMELQKNKNSKS